MPSSAAPDFDPAIAPGEPLTLFAEWLDTAMRSEVAAPHAMTLATVSPAGAPTARTVLLHDFHPGDDSGYLGFASNGNSPKGIDLATDDRAALVFHWREQHRQVRLTGRVHAASDAENAADFRNLSARARAATIAVPQSAPEPDQAETERLLAAADQILAADPHYAPPTWKLYRLVPDSVEFWQGQPRTPQQRLLYQRDPGPWATTMLWP